MTATLIWLSCVAVAWAPSTGAPDGYHVEVTGIATADVATNRYVVCIPETNVPASLRVQGFDASGDGPWSDPLILERVHDFDPTGDGVVGWPDFAEFVAAFGCRYLPSGIAENCR